MIDIQISPELSYVLAVAHVLWNYAWVAYLVALAGACIVKEQKQKAALCLLGAIFLSVWCAPSIWTLTRWYAQLAELRRW